MPPSLGVSGWWPKHPHDDPLCTRPELLFVVNVSDDCLPSSVTWKHASLQQSWESGTARPHFFPISPCSVPSSLPRCVPGPAPAQPPTACQPPPAVPGLLHLHPALACLTPSCSSRVPSLLVTPGKGLLTFSGGQPQRRLREVGVGPVE